MTAVSAPSIWKLVRLAEAAEVTMGSSPPGESYNETGDGIPLINGPVEFSEGDFGLTIRSKFTTSPTRLCKKDDLLLCVRGSTTGRTNIAGFDACVGRGVASIRARGDQSYLNHFIRTQRQRLFDVGNGSTFPSITQEQLVSVQVPLPNLPEQRRIAAILDKADAIRRKREEGIRLTEELLRSTFLDLFGDPEENSDWIEKSLGDVVDIASGQVDPKKEPYSSMQHVGGDNIASHTGEISGAATAEELGLISGKYEFTSKDVLYSKIRPALNKVACPNFEGICSADIYPIRPRPGKVSREFLACLLRSDDFMTYASKHSSRTNIPKINRPALLAFQVKLPPFKEQLRFDTIAKRIREMKHQRLTAFGVAENCFDALVQRAFRGEL